MQWPRHGRSKDDVMHPDYINAIETRLRWLKWGLERWKRQDVWGKDQEGDDLRQYLHVLQHGPSYYMDQHFCRLVDHARLQIPQEMKFEVEWLLSREGWLYVSEPFETPAIKGLASDRSILPSLGPGISTGVGRIAAIGWFPVADGYQFVTFHSDDQPGFGCWSYFAVRDGDDLRGRVIRLETSYQRSDLSGGAYQRVDDPKHELIWVYTAMYLMAQRLAIMVRHQTDRHTRRRAERDKQEAPPFIEVVTLRRLQAKRDLDRIPADVDWQWQWHVRGHWREQWYPKENIHKPKFIEAYLKGPEDKPLKPPTIKLFTAVR